MKKSIGGTMSETKRFSQVVDWNKHIEPYRVVQFVAGVGSGKNYWVENILMNERKVLLITSRKAKVNETSERLKIGTKLNFTKLETDALKYFWTQNRQDGSCVCNNWQIEHYMKHHFRPDDAETYLWNFFDIIVIDEVHSLATDATFVDAPFYLLDFIKAVYRLSNKKTVLMTATFEPIRGLVKLKNKADYAFWDVTDDCRNLLPDKLWFQTTEFTLQEMVRDYQIKKNAKKQGVALPDSKWIYFATRISTIANTIVPYLVKSGIPENQIAVSFSDYEDAEKSFSQVLLENKVRVEQSLKTSEDLPDDITIFISTSRNKEGINIDNPDLYWNVAIESHWTDEVAQMWGRVRHGLSQCGDVNLSPTDKVIIVYDAPQHQKRYCDDDYKAILSACCVEGVNRTMNHWCGRNNLPTTNRFQDQQTKNKINETVKEFPYLRYSIVEDKFLIYRGKILGERSYTKSVDNFDAYVSAWLGESDGAFCVPPFSIKSFLICPTKRTESFEDYISENGFDDGRYITKAEQSEMLNFISNVLMLRKGSQKTEKYTSLSKAVRRYGWQLVSVGSNNPKSSTYGCSKLVRMTKTADGGVWDDSI